MKTRRHHCMPQHGSVSANIHNVDIENNLAPGKERDVFPFPWKGQQKNDNFFYEHLIYKCTRILKGIYVLYATDGEIESVKYK